VVVPAVTAICVVGVVMYLRARRGQPKRLLDRKVEPLAAKQVWAGVPLVIAVALALSFVQLPTQVSSAPIDRASPGQLTFAQPLVAPPGWTTVQRRNYDDVKRLYGDNAVLVRQWMTELTGDRRFDKLSRPRTVVVDSLVSRRPFTFGVYPARVLYGLTFARFSAFRPVDLGMGVTARMLSVVDDDLLAEVFREQLRISAAQIVRLRCLDGGAALQQAPHRLRGMLNRRARIDR